MRLYVWTFIDVHEYRLFRNVSETLERSIDLETVEKKGLYGFYFTKNRRRENLLGRREESTTIFEDFTATFATAHIFCDRPCAYLFRGKKHRDHCQMCTHAAI